jgi:sec-independent protein translocase protein TatC
MDEPKGGGGEASPPEQNQPEKTVYPDDPYGGATTAEVGPAAPAPTQAVVVAGGERKPPPPPPPDDDEEDGEEDGMLRMSFLDHLEELRSRLIRMLAGFGVSFVVCLVFADRLWLIVQAPAADALKKIGKGSLVAISPMEQFSIIYVWTPVVASIFVASPWILYQIWAFIAPGLYKKERRWAVPFVLTTAGLFITGGLFAYFIAFRYGLAFLLNIGGFANVQSMVSIELYFELFVNVMLGVSLVFEMPVVIFFLTLLRLASPRWLLANSRYAILAITVLAAVVTPTPDIFNMMLFAVPMCALFFVGLFASFLLVWKREGKIIPWKRILIGIALVLIAVAVFGFLAVQHYHLRVVPHWPFLTK